jgi:hypothetical protein
MDGLKALQDAGGQLQEQKQAALRPMLKDIQAQGAQLGNMQPPGLQAAPKAPQASQIGQGMMEYMQIATVMAALAGGLSRRGTTASLNAFSGAIQGFTQGKFQIFQQKMEEWKAASDEVSTNNRSMLDQYDRIWRNKKLNLDQKMEEYKLVASQHQDEISYNLANQRNYTMLAQANEKVREFQDKHDQAAEKIKLGWARLQEQYDSMTNPSRGTAGTMAIRKYLQENPNATSEDVKKFAGALAQEQSYGRSSGTQSARVENASNEVAQLIPQAMETSKALPRGKFVPWNKLQQQWEAGSSDPAYNDFIMANFALINAYTRAMNPLGVPRINDRLEQKANGILSVATSPQAYQVQINRLWKEVQASKSATQETREGASPAGAPMPISQGGARVPPDDEGWGPIERH